MTKGIQVLAKVPSDAEIRAEELAKLGGAAAGRLREASEILDALVKDQKFVEFLTFPAYRILE